MLKSISRTVFYTAIAFTTLFVLKLAIIVLIALTSNDTSSAPVIMST